MDCWSIELDIGPSTYHNVINGSVKSHYPGVGINLTSGADPEIFSRGGGSNLDI